MSDKWTKLSIYDVEFELEDADGEKHVFTFKPLPWETFPDAYQALHKLNESGFFTEHGDLPEEELLQKFFQNINKELIKELSSVLKKMVENSYPDKDEDTINRFVMGNLFPLIGALMQVISRQSKDTRKANKAMG